MRVGKKGASQCPGRLRPVGEIIRKVKNAAAERKPVVDRGRAVQHSVIRSFTRNVSASLTLTLPSSRVLKAVILDGKLPVLPGASARGPDLRAFSCPRASRAGAGRRPAPADGPARAGKP